MSNYDVHFYLVVEKEDLQDYLDCNPQIKKDSYLVLPESDKGIAYVRNFCKKHAQDAGHDYHWQIDDNIRRFKIRIAGKNVIKAPQVVLMEAEEYVQEYSNIGLAGLKHAAFAFAARDDMSFNQQIYTCMLINNHSDIKWRDNCVEDTDYSMQILTAGYTTVLFNRLIMDKATTGKMKGGNTEISYGGDGRKKRSEGLQKNWPNIFKTKIDGNGETRIKPSRIWKSFPQRPRLKETECDFKR